MLFRPIHKSMNKIILFAPHKKPGQNSLIKYAESIVQNVQGCTLKELPSDSNSVRGLIKNIKFVRQNCGTINHIIAHGEGYLMPFLKGKKIITVHDIGTLKTHGIIAFIFLYILNIIPIKLFANSILFNSAQTQKEFLGFFKVGKQRSKIIYLLPQTSIYYKDKPFNTEKPNILHIGTAGRKNLENVIKAVCGLSIKMTIVGILSENQEKLLQENNVDYNNVFDISSSDLADLYAESDMVTFPSFYEGFGLITIESQLAGRPVITSNTVPVLQEAAGEGAYYVNPYSVTEIRQAIIEICNEPKLRNNLINKGFDNVRKYSKDKFAENMQTIYSI